MEEVLFKDKMEVEMEQELPQNKVEMEEGPRRYDVGTATGDTTKKGRTKKEKDLIRCCAMMIFVVVCVAVGLVTYFAVESMKQHNHLKATTPPPTEESHPGNIYQNAAVATDVPECSEMGRNVLEMGGSAVDSALASLLCIGLFNGQSSGIGGGFVMVVYDRADGHVETLNALEEAYAASYPEMFDGQGPDAAKYGMEAVAIPGELRGLWDAHQKYGVLDWADLFHPVIDLARNGFRVGGHLDYALSTLEDRWDEFPRLKAMYWNDAENRVVREGDTMTQPEFADTLQAIADNGVEEFYTGQTAVKLIQDIKTGGGHMVLGDLANYTTFWSDPETLEDFSPSHHTVFSSQLTASGQLLEFIIRTMEGFGLASSDDMTEDQETELYHRFIEVCKFGFGQRIYLGDTWSSEVEKALENMRSPEFSAYIRGLIETASPNVVSTDSEIYAVNFTAETVDDLDVGDTSHVSVLAPNGDAVSITTSVGYYFGCKDVSPSTGLVLNNHIRNYDYEGKYGTWRSPANELSPGRRHMTTISPALIVDQSGDAKLIVGGSGGSRIPTAVSWVIIRSLLMDVPLDDAIDEPRIQNSLSTNVAFYEASFSQIIAESLEQRGHVVSYSSSFAAVQGILRTSEGIVAYSDPRKGGRAAGY